MKTYALGLVAPRFVTISSSTNAAPIVVTTTAPHGFTLADVITINGVLVNTAANGTYSNANALVPQFSIPSPTTISLTLATGNGAGVATGTASAPQRLINAPSFPTIQGVADNSKLLVAGILMVPAAFTTAVLFVGLAGLNQGTLANVTRTVNLPPAGGGRFDDYTITLDGHDTVPIGDYWVDAAKPGTEAILASFWTS